MVVLIKNKLEMKKSLLFVCLGNICRSPSAEAIFKSMVDREGLGNEIEVDSAGILGVHSGDKADSRMRSHASKRGYNLESISRKFNPTIDFDKFDLIIGMDDENIADLKRMARSESDLQKIHKMTDFSVKFNYSVVPDPYYGGDKGFELVIDLLEDACSNLLSNVRKSL